VRGFARGTRAAFVTWMVVISFAGFAKAQGVPIPDQQAIAMLVMLEDFYLKFTHIEVRDRTFKEHYASIRGPAIDRSLRSSC